MVTRNERIADLLMGAAYADAQLDGRESEAVAACLAKAMDVDALPAEMKERIRSFDPRDFDPADAARSLGLEGEADKLQLIAFLAAVTDADGSFDLDENAYLEQVAEALGLPEEVERYRQVFGANGMTAQPVMI